MSEDVEVGAGTSESRGSSKPRPLERRCPECNKVMVLQHGGWWCPDDWVFEQAWDAFYWARRNPAIPLDER